MLEIADLHAGYGHSQVLRGVSLQVAPGRIVCLLGRNGSGRSTLARCILGLLPSRGGLRWQGRSLQGLRPFQVVRQGVGYVPEDRAIFPELSVQQNLQLGEPSGPRQAPGGLDWTVQDCYRSFPALMERRHTPGAALSGGEQQMLALCRCLMGRPALVVVDEPTEGLAPQVVAQVGALLRLLRERGVAVLLIEQKLSLAMEIADTLLVMGQGRVVFSGDASALQQAHTVRQQWLEV